VSSAFQPRAGGAAPAGDTVTLQAVFGYESIDAHEKWRQTPEAKKSLEDAAGLVGEVGLDSYLVGGLDNFHVKFKLLHDPGS
jgi:hypothetical protein